MKNQEELEEKLKKIRLLVMDVDGTMTRGDIYIDSQETETKQFNIKDGCGITVGQTAGLEFMILTGRESACLQKRARELKIRRVYQNVKNKADFLAGYLAREEISSDETAYIGDDINDLYAMQMAGISFCPLDAAEEIRHISHVVLEHRGGDGAVREAIERILKSAGKWEDAIKLAFGPGSE